MLDAAVDPKHAFWVEKIGEYDKEAQTWETKGKKVVKVFVGDREGVNSKAATFNILWSNIQTLMPAIFDRAPKPNIERRFDAQDPVGREAAIVLERCSTFFIEQGDFYEKVRQAVLDRLLPGRGTIWVRYDATFEKQAVDPQVTDDVTEQLLYEDVAYDYVHWKDFGHTVARTWQEVRGVWRVVGMTRRELIKRFGEEIGRAVPLSTTDPENVREAHVERAFVYEIWDKENKEVVWLCKDYPQPLDVRPDPLGLSGFFPCPKPLLATVANDGLIPTPDYTIYYDQALELDQLTGRIDLLLKAVKVAGVYDGSAEGIGRLLGEGLENKLIPINNWAMFGEKGGLAGSVQFMPLDQIVNTIQFLYTARERIKQDLYEITGLSDIIRGASVASETATAQQIKGQYASMRLNDMQKDVARFCRDLVRITVEILGNIFDPETLRQISGSKLLTAQQAQLMQMQGMPVPNKPLFDDVVALIKNDLARTFRIDIQTDSTIKADQEAEKAMRAEFLAAAGGFIQQAATVATPELKPLLAKMLMFGVQGFKAGRDLESAFEEYTATLDQPPAPPQAPQPDPRAMIEEKKLELEAQRMQADVQAAQMKAQTDMTKVQADSELKRAQLEAETLAKAKEMALREAELALRERELQNQLMLEIERFKAQLIERREARANPETEQPEAPDADDIALLAAIQNMTIALQQMNQPKQVVRDANGRIVGIQPVGAVQ